MKNKRLFCLPSLYYTHGGAGYACAGAQAKKNPIFNNKSPQSDFPINPTEKLSAYLCCIFMH